MGHDSSQKIIEVLLWVYPACLAGLNQAVVEGGGAASPLASDEQIVLYGHRFSSTDKISISPCVRAAEKFARENKKGIWADPGLAPRPPPETESVVNLEDHYLASINSQVTWVEWTELATRGWFPGPMSPAFPAVFYCGIFSEQGSFYLLG